MVSISDLKRRTKEVPTEAGPLIVKAISMRGLAHIIEKSPIVERLLAGGVNIGKLLADPMKLIELAPDLVEAMIAAGLDFMDKPEELAIIADLDLGTQADLLMGVVEASMPKGIVPFIEQVTALIGKLADVGGGPVTSSPKE